MARERHLEGRGTGTDGSGQLEQGRTLLLGMGWTGTPHGQTGGCSLKTPKSSLEVVKTAA